MRFARLTVLGLGVALALAAAGSAAAQLPELPFGKWWKKPEVVQMLKLTTEQQEKLDETFSKNRRVFIDLKAEMEKRQIDLEDLMTRKDADPKKVVAASETLEQARAKLGRARTLMILEMRGILTQAQWQAIVEKREQWRDERENERRRLRRMGPGTLGPGGLRRPFRGGGAPEGVPPPASAPNIE